MATETDEAITDDEKALLDALVARGCIDAYLATVDGIELRFIDGSTILIGATCDMVGNSVLFIDNGVNL